MSSQPEKWFVTDPACCQCLYAEGPYAYQGVQICHLEDEGCYRIAHGRFRFYSDKEGPESAESPDFVRPADQVYRGENPAHRLLAAAALKQRDYWTTCLIPGCSLSFEGAKAYLQTLVDCELD